MAETQDPKDVRPSDALPSGTPHSPYGAAAISHHEGDRLICPEDEAFYRALRKEVRPKLFKSYLDDIKYTAGGRLALRKWSDVMEIISKFLSGAATILAFSSAPIDEGHKLVSFLAGVCGTLSLVALLFASYLNRQAKERNIQLNIMLERIGIEPLPDNIINLDAEDAGEQAGGLNTAGSQAASTQLEQADAGQRTRLLPGRRHSRGAFPPVIDLERN